jgi:NAD(P)-dependent dehydrogenase (short-subunit alcohol dehydrogenase family)
LADNHRDRGWTADNVPDQSGKTCLVTGANSGLGFACAGVLVGRGARVVLACRNSERGRRALDAVRAEHPGSEIELLSLDLANLARIRDAADRFRDAHDRLDILVNNAGLMALPQLRTADGFEMQFGTNHFGHFALTGLLLPALLGTPGSRVVTVSSLMHRRGRIDFDDPFFDRHPYSKWAAYGRSKLANLLFTFELDRRLRRHRARTIALAAHPGYAATELQGKGPRMGGWRMASLLMRLGNASVAQSAAAGAWPLLRAATDPQAQGGEFFGPGGLGESRGPAVRVEAIADARDPGIAERLWTLSEQLTGITFAFDRGRDGGTR